MMRLDEIRNPQFSLSRKDGYDTREVDQYISDVYETVSQLFKTGKQYDEKLKSINAVISKYNADKEAISEILIESKATAQKVKKEAEETASKIREEAFNEAEALKSSAQSIYDKAEASANSKYDEIVANANEKAQQIINEAKANSAKIVSDAYEEASKAKDASERIVAEANAKIDGIKNKVSNLKSVYNTISSEISVLLDSINVAGSDDPIEE